MTTDLEYEIRQLYEKRGYDVIQTGKPDLICFKNNRIIFVEIKSENDTLRPDQKRAAYLIRRHHHQIRFEGPGAGNARNELKRSKMYLSKDLKDERKLIKGRRDYQRYRIKRK